MIKVFNSDDKTYETNGNVVLNPTYANVHKEDNGEYYLDLETSIEEDKIKHIEHEEGTTIETTGTTLTNVDTTKEHKFISLYGETQQDSTTGKNICSNITKPANANLKFFVSKKIAQTFTISFTTNEALNGNSLYLEVDGTGYGNLGGITASANTRATKTYTLSNENYQAIQNGTTIDLLLYKNGANFTIPTDAQIENGSSMTDFEPYTGGSPAPSPSYPFDIHNVSGDNTIEICGKNRLNSSNLYIFNSNKYIATTNYTTKGVIKVQPNTTYSISFEDVRSALSDRKIYSYDKNNVRTQLSLTNTEASDYTLYSFTTLNDTETIGFYIGGVTAYNSVEEFLSAYKLMLINGNTFLSYEAYQGNSQLISLGVENLFDKDNATYKNGYYKDNNGMEQTTIASGYLLTYIPVQPNTKYTIQGSFKTIPSAQSYAIYFYDTSKNWISRISTQDAPPFTFTTPNNCYYIQFQYIKEVFNANIVQLEKGSKANSYSEYGKPYIELNKISTYQDYIYKSSGKWYLHKEIGKVVLNGSETIDYNSSSNWTFRYTPPNALKNSTQGDGTLVKSNYFISTSNLGIDEAISAFYGQIVFKYDLYKTGSSNDFKTWLSTHNTIVYYVLAEPTDTEITDTTLLEQLNNFEKMKLYNGITNISITPNDLTPIIKLHYNYITGGDVVINNNDNIKPNNIIVANTPTGEQAFRITDIEKRKHKIVLKAWHISYDTKNYVIQDSYVVDKTCNQAMDHLNNATDNISPFTTTSDITTINSYRCVRRSLFEAFNVVLERWGGHFVRDNWNFKIMNSIGQDNGVVVRYAKNLKDIEVDYNWDDVCTKILPVGDDGLMLDEIYLYADIQYDIPYSKVIHFAQNVDTTPYEDEDGNLDEDAYTQALKNDLRSQANNYLQEHQLPQVNYTLQANLEKITDVGDIIQVIDERLGVNITTSLISFDYDPILERYTYLEFGNFKKQLSNLTEIMATQTNEIVSEATATTRITLENELNEATSKIWGVLGSSYVLVEGDKILILDSLPKETATNVIMLNSAGIGFSNTGINGTFTSAWTIDNVLNMQNINVINLTADLIKGGTLKLGSNLNQNGILEVYDESNNLIAELNKDGLKMFATDGGYILINTTVGFAGYDRNNVKIYWADGDEFHMKKSVVEEEITLVDKMRIIPITITNNGTIVNDGIGFVSTL